MAGNLIPNVLNEALSIKESGEEEINITNTSTSESDLEFDTIVGALQDVLMDEKFVEKQNTFAKLHAHEFTDDEENKLVYTTLFEEYNVAIEDYIDVKLKEAVPSFSMEKLCTMLEERQDEITADVFDVLMSISNFEEFKLFMLSYKQPTEDMQLQGTAVEEEST